MVESVHVHLPPPFGDQVVLHRDRALYWPTGRTLFLADPHVGKPASFHRAGIALPSSVTAADLDRLNRLLHTTGAQRAVILGDFLHASPSQGADTTAALSAWRSQIPDVSLLLVRGNHDRHAGPPPESLGITVVDEPYSLPPFVCRHEPMVHPAPQGSGPPVLYELAGHLHPQVTLRDADGTSVRLPCFLVGRFRLLLPAFGSFTGGLTVAPTAGDRVFVLTGEGIYEAQTKARR